MFVELAVRAGVIKDKNILLLIIRWLFLIYHAR